jgi:signal peptidase
VLVGLACAVLVGLALGRLVPLAGGSTLVVAGGSMAPAVPLGAAIVAVPVDPGEIAVGDIVSIRLDAGSTIFTHRVIRIVERSGEPWLETRGDANPGADPALVPATAVVGRVVVTVPYAGYLLRLLSTAAGVLFLVSLAATLLVAGRLLDQHAADGVDAAVDEGAAGTTAEEAAGLAVARGSG